MSDIRYMLFQNEGLQNKTDSSKISKKEIIATGAAGLMPRSNFQTLAACDPEIADQMADTLSRRGGDVMFNEGDGTFHIVGQRPFHVVKEGKDYNIKELGATVSTCDDRHCGVRYAYRLGDPVLMLRVIQAKATGNWSGVYALLKSVKKSTPSSFV